MAPGKDVIGKKNNVLQMTRRDRKVFDTNREHIGTAHHLQ